MILPRLTWRSVVVRTVLVPLRRPVVSKVGQFSEWPLILIDLITEEGIIGHSYLEPYLAHAAGSIVPVIDHLAASRKGRRVCPVDDYAQGRKALTLIGQEGVALIAVSGLDMAAWDALAKAAGMPLAVLLGGSLGPVKAYNSNGLWLSPPDGLGDEARELEAEAVAFVVGQAIGLEVAEASRDYIHLYRGDSNALTASLERIQRTASSILQAIRVDGKAVLNAA